MFINGNIPRGRHTSTCINLVLLSVQQMLRLATLGFRTRRGTSANRSRSPNQSIVSILYTAAASKCDWAVQLVFVLFTGTPDISFAPTDRDCGYAMQPGCLDGLSFWPPRPIHQPRLWIHFQWNTKRLMHSVCFSVQLNRPDSSVQGHICNANLHCCKYPWLLNPCESHLRFCAVVTGNDVRNKIVEFR
jgi:hypothetical protein